MTAQELIDKLEVLPDEAKALEVVVEILDMHCNELDGEDICASIVSVCVYASDHWSGVVIAGKE